MNLLKTIFFILFATIMISCADEDKSDQDTTSVQEKEDATPIQDNKAPTPVQDNKAPTPVQDNKDVKPVQENKPITGFYQNMKDFLPEEKKKKPVQQKNTIRTTQVSKVNPFKELGNGTRTWEDILGKARLADMETETETETKLKDDTFLVIPIGDFKGLKISLTKLTNSMIRVFRFGKNSEVSNISFREGNAWREFLNSISIDQFYISFSVKKDRRVLEYECDIYFSRPIIFRDRSWSTYYVPKHARKFYLKIDSCNQDPVIPIISYNFKLPDIVFDKAQLESYLERIHNEDT